MRREPFLSSISSQNELEFCEVVSVFVTLCKSQVLRMRLNLAEYILRGDVL